jgi:hypothetical protein
VPLNLRASKKLRGFDFGVSYKVNETRDRFKDALNVFSIQNRLETRHGRSLYNSTLLSGPVLSMSFFKNAAGDRHILAKVGTTLYKVNPSGAHTAIKTGLSAGTKHRGITWAKGESSRHIISIEGDGLFQWDGTNFTVLGSPPPEGHTVSSVVGTLAAASYRVHITFYSSKTGFESNSTYSAPITMDGTHGIRVSNLPTTCTNATVDKLKFYLENITNGDDAIYAGVVSLGTLTFDIAGPPDSELTVPYSNAAPLSGGGKYFTEFNRKLVYAGNSTYKNDVYFSELDMPDAFNDGNGPDRVVLYASGNGEITGLATGLYNYSVLDPYLVVFKRRSIEVYSEIGGESKSSVISRDVGCVSHDTIQVINGNVFFLSDQGWRMIENGRLVVADTGRPITLGLGDVDDVFTQRGFSYECNKAQVHNAFSVYYSTLDQYITWIPEGASTDMVRAYNFELKTNGFKPYQFYTPSTAACIGIDGNAMEIVYMGDANGAIYSHSILEDRADADSTGTAQPIDAFAIMAWLDGDDMDASFNFREIIVRRIVGNGTLTGRVSVNYASDTVGDDMAFLAPASGFTLDDDQLDGGEFGEDERTIVTARADINQCGENIMIGFYQNLLNTNMALVSAQIDFSKNGNRN